MIDIQQFEQSKPGSGDRGDTTILLSTSTSGAAKVLAYSHHDHCFFVKIGERERLRSDSLDMVLPFFNGEYSE